MIEYVVMGYDGEPVTIKNGEIYEAEEPPGYYDRVTDKFKLPRWNPETQEWNWEEDDDNDEPLGNDRELYGLGWYDCNTDLRNW